MQDSKRRWLRVLCLGATVVGAGGYAACTGVIGDGTDGVGTSESSLCAVDTPMRRMTRFEYNNTVRDLLRDDTRPADVFPPEEEVQGFDNQAAALNVSELLAEQYLKVAEGISERAVADMDALLEGCDPATDGEVVCADRFIESFGRRAYRRPLDTEDIEHYQALYDEAMADPDLATFETAIRMIIEAVLQSPNFLYRPEFGGGDPIDTDVVAITSWERASKLSYMLWNSMPDDELLDAAEADELATPEQLEAQARRMLEDGRAKDAIRNFHEQWLLLRRLDTVSKDGNIYPAYYDGIRPLWKQEIDRFIEDAILEGDGTLETLLTAPYTFMNADLAAFYGVDGPSGDDLERVDLDPDRYAGILTQGALMATLAKGDQTSPVYRGKWVREQLMCDILPSPPANLVIVPPMLDSEKTTREQFEEIGNNPDCAGCHTLMNPIGFGFEHYDAIGLWRDQQNGKDIDATGEIVASDDIDGTFDGAVELAHKLASSEQVRSCVSSQWFRFSYGRTVTQEDSCSIEQLGEVFAASGYDIKELLVALTQTDAFLYRHQVVAEGGGS